MKKEKLEIFSSFLSENGSLGHKMSVATNPEAILSNDVEIWHIEKTNFWVLSIVDIQAFLNIFPKTSKTT